MSEIHDRLRDYWDQDAVTYDRTPSHAVSDPVERAAWRAALSSALPGPGSAVLDVGAGTGSLSLLAAELGCRVTALDLSEGMLSRAREKAIAAGLSIDTVVASATEPPDGPFDAVMERHLLWTLPDPVGALSAWRAVAPGGRLALFEGMWHQEGPVHDAKRAIVRGLRRVRGEAHDHHAEYDPGLRSSLPFASGMTPGGVLQAAEEAGWRRVRIERLRDVEWARRLASDPMVGPLQAIPLFAVLADA
jgi:ubiquinone/menaquinone biosynthesis C-methylase UbiE